MSQMTMLPVRQGIPIRQPRCVRCRSLIDVWAQFVCDDCRQLPLWAFIWKLSSPREVA
jgi:hypothetical protein